MLTLLRLKCCSNCSLQPFTNPCFKRSLSTSQLKDYYSLLQCTRSSTQKEIKESFLRLSKVYHPDNNETGSHTKFVKLKEAYDAIKDGPPTVTSYSRYSSPSNSSSTSSNYSNNDFDEDINKSAHAFYRERQARYRGSTRFGGAYGGSSTAWEDLKRDQAYRKSKQQTGFHLFGRSAMSTTIALSAIAWVFIYSGVLLVWEHNERVKDNLYRFRPRSHSDYLAYEEYMRRREQEQLLKSRRVVGDRTSNSNNIHRNNMKNVDITQKDSTSDSTTSDKLPKRSKNHVLAKYQQEKSKHQHDNITNDGFSNVDHDDSIPLKAAIQ